MAKRAIELSALQVRALAESANQGFHAVGGVAGLYLRTVGGSCSWVLRTVIAGKRRDMGLGGFPSVTLAGARERAREARLAIDVGQDPIDQRGAAKRLLRASVAKTVTFEQAATSYIAANEAAWKNAKHAAQWVTTLRTYAYPVIGEMRVADVETAHVKAIIEPIWYTKTETAKRLLGRIERVLSSATTAGYRDGLNPARWDDHFQNILPAPGKIQTRKHHEAMPLDSVGAFMVRLARIEGIAAKALAFLVLTATRSGDVRGAAWNEVDLKVGVWTIPANRIKAGTELRVPLSVPALTLLRSLPHDGDLVFPTTKGKALSDMAFLMLMRRMKVDAVPHGFRSTFRDWVGERTSFPTDLAEMSLAHKIQNKVEAAYARSDLFDKRRALMSAWAAFVGTVATPVADNVVPMGMTRRATN